MGMLVMTVNGVKRSVEAPAEESLLSVLRNRLQLTGTKYGCGEGQLRAAAATERAEQLLFLAAERGSADRAKLAASGGKIAKPATGKAIAAQPATGAEGYAEGLRG